MNLCCCCCCFFLLDARVSIILKLKHVSYEWSRVFFQRKNSFCKCFCFWCIHLGHRILVPTWTIGPDFVPFQARHTHTHHRWMLPHVIDKPTNDQSIVGQQMFFFLPILKIKLMCVRLSGEDPSPKIESGPNWPINRP